MPYQPAHPIWTAATSIEQQIAARDLFALGLYLISTGQSEAGSKACSAAMASIGASTEDSQQFQGAATPRLHWIDANVAPHAEIRSLFEE